jgi:DNA mismatch repair protein MutS
MKTAFFQKYKKIKEQYQNEIVLIKLGDFLEAFGKDAETISKILDLTLTGRICDRETNERILVTGFPFHVLNKFTAKLAENNIQVKVVNEL